MLASCFMEESMKGPVEQIGVTSTSRDSATCSDILVRDGDRVRLVFRPEIVANQRDPKAAVKGRFLYQKKAAAAEWVDFDRLPLTSVKQGEGYQLELKSGELWPLLRALRDLYILHQKEGVPQGHVDFVKVDEHLNALLKLSEPALGALIAENPGQAIAAAQRLLRWLANNPESIDDLASGRVDLPEINALVGLANLRFVLREWEQNSTNEEGEEFWQDLFARHTFVLSLLFSYPVVIVKDKAYVGGKQIDNRHGAVVDFLFATRTSGTALLIEIKTPATALLDKTSYRRDIFAPSREVVGAIAQVLHYKETLSTNLDTLRLGTPMSGGEPKCLVIVGDSAELIEEAQKKSFERFRERLMGVTLLTFDEVFTKVSDLVSILAEQPDKPDQADDEEWF